MTRTLRYLLLFVLTGLSGSAFAQEISGRVLDDKKEPLPSAVIQVYQGGILKGGNVTDYDGNYTVKPLDPGYYNVLVLYAGYDSIMITDVVVTPGQRTTQNFQMARKSVTVKGNFVVKAYKKPLIDQDKPASKVLTKDEINVIPTNQVTDLVSTTTGVYQAQRGQAVNMSGARNTGTLYVIDGVQVRGNSGVDMAQGSIDQLEVITSGIPANYGDVSGGVVNITSRGVSQKLTGDIRLQHSIDGYKNNLASFSIAGPVYKKKTKDDKGEVTKKPVLGFALSGDVYNDNDRYPYYDKQYQAKPDVLKRLLANPLTISTGADGRRVYNNASDYITLDSLTTNKLKPGNKIQEERLNGKLDFQLTDNMHIVAGGMLDYLKQDQYSRARELFDVGATPSRTTINGRGYLRFTQKFGKTGDTSSRHSIISNAYYTVQADYQKTYQSQQDPTFKENIFKYGYVGTFHENRSPFYFVNGIDSLTGKHGTVLQGSAPVSVTYDRSTTLNPNLSNYTSEYYNSLNGFNPFVFGQIQQGSGLLNGDEPALTYQMFFSPASTQSYYLKFNSNQYALTVDASFDLLLGKTRHSIGFGLYYQQRVEKQFVAVSNLQGYGAAGTLWSQMRLLVSSISNGGLVLDKTNPLFRVNGNTYTLSQINQHVVIPGPNDTILYNYRNVKNSTFDQNLRKKLLAEGYIKNINDDINVDALPVSTFSLGMFSADELIANGLNYVQYYGYSYTGGALTGTVNFNDFWTKKDANGNYTRPIGAFSPNYIAGYVLDKFNYKDLHFNVGLRIDRFSANTKVLIDPYSEYAETKVSGYAGTFNALNGGSHPANMGSNYIVYVDNNSAANPAVIGYRNGDTWYDYSGKVISDPSILKNYSNGQTPQPLTPKVNGVLPNIQTSSYNPNSAFTDYTPQVTLQPRLSFNFPISEVADFYAHYDIYSQRPESNVQTTAADYFNLINTANNVINNPNLKSQRTFDYEVGFQQKLTTSSAVTISAFYKERKDQITIVPLINAYPTTYYSYGNRDFSTTKGTTISYDMRATNHLRMNIAYTLQFAEGTGSSPTSGNRQGFGGVDPNGLLQSFVQAGVPNTRYITSLDYDSRHLIAANIDYRYGEGEGPVVGGKSIFQNAGVDFIAKARSGEPYTKYLDALGHTVTGGVNGARLPWHYGIDMRIDKDFALNFGRKQKLAPTGVKPKRPLYLKAIAQVNNLLQTRDIIHVYGYTGRSNDDGYLASPYGKQFAPQQIDPTAYSQMYTINTNNPSNLNYARTISLALEFNF
jgi:hypothetical protein